MGDKITAKKLAFEAGVPVLKSSDEPSEFGSLGFPILIKAAAGRWRQRHARGRVRCRT